MKKKLLLLSLILSNILFSSNGKYRLVLTDDPSTTIMIGWNQISGTDPVVYYGTTDFGDDYSSYTNSKTVDRSVSYKGMTNTFSKLDGLLPNTNYYFVIKDSEGTSQRFWFRTAPNTNVEMSFISGGDSRNNRGPRQDANLLVSKLKPTAVFFGGDMTNSDTNVQWIEWFDDWQLTIAADGRMFPIVPARGNHEQSNESISKLFNVPSADIYYKLTFGDNLYSIYTLNSEITAGGSQVSWLQSELTTDNSIWKSAQYHKPMRPHVSNKAEGDDEYSNWSQLFYDEGVRLIYESDSHTVKTTWPVKPCASGANCEEGFERDDLNGTTYVGEGCWGAPIRNSDDGKVWTRNSGSFNQFKWVTVSEKQIDVKTILVDNSSQVLSNTNDSDWSLPYGIGVWEPSNGNTVTILNNSALDIPNISIISHTDDEYVPDASNVTLTANASDNDGTIDYVEFLVNGVLVNTVYFSPFETTYTFANGVNMLEVKAYDNNGLSSTDFMGLRVGEYSDSLDLIASKDVEQHGNNPEGLIYEGSSDLELVYDTDNNRRYQTIGIRFENLGIPPNAVIDNAYIQFTAKGNQSNASSFLISVENSDNATNFDENDDFNVTNRNFLPSVSWSPQAWNDGDSGVAQRTPSLVSSFQDIVNSANWNANNAAVIKIEASGVSLTNQNAIRRAHSLDGSGTGPMLHVEYTVTSNVLSTKSINDSFSVSLYPNPVIDILNLDLPKTNKNWTIQIYTISGSLLYDNTLKNNQINLSTLKSGLYFISVLDEKNKVYLTDRIIKK
tara:strand:+ start:2797 stop:5139 length:2343 start_codon:yes stop_codon:yes gene_type:complete